MTPVTDLGKALAQLRSILGLSIDECAARVQTTPALLKAAERGDIDQAALQGIARLYAIDEERLREGLVTPTEGSTVFLLHGAYTDFDTRDLGVLGRAMRTARLAASLAVASGASEALRLRLQFVPVSPIGPKPADAARQGHKLARLVRDRLGLGGAPIADMAELLAERLGIVVLVDTLESTDLRAAAILDAHRAAAAAVLAADDPHRQQNPTLARVYLAHELCHLLFDPGAPGSVRLVLDNNPGGRRGAPGGPSVAALLESRAKGFAAEFLLPLKGIEDLLDAPAGASRSPGELRDMVDTVRHRFGTPWEIARNHLENLGFVPWEHERNPPRDRPSSAPTRTPTSLPAPGALPRGLAELLARAGVDDAVETLSASAEVRHAPPSYVGEARDAVSATLTELGTSAIDRSLRAIQEERPIDAVDTLVEHLDDLFLTGEFAVARDFLDRLDPRLFPPRVLTGVLMVSSHARDELGDARTRFFTRVEAALTEVWRLPSEQLAAVVRRLQ